jgi:hypothetical protein
VVARDLGLYGLVVGSRRGSARSNCSGVVMEFLRQQVSRGRGRASHRAGVPAARASESR